jgi:hypothetical protein
MSIFEKDSFSLKEFCKTFIKFSDQVSIISKCYILFASGNNNYRKLLNDTRRYKGLLCLDEISSKEINFREILQIFDMEFTKLVIRINTEAKDYDIYITWKDLEDKFHNLTKDKLIGLLT